MSPDKKFEEEFAAAARMTCPPLAGTFRVFDNRNPNQPLGTVTISGGAYTTEQGEEGDIRLPEPLAERHTWQEPRGQPNWPNPNLNRWGFLSCNELTGTWEWTETNRNGFERVGTLQPGQ